MASLTVGNLICGFSSIRTQSYRSEPVYDSSGKRYVCDRISLDVIGLLNSAVVATNKPLPRGVGADNLGDALPNTMFEISDYLMRPRRAVTFAVGGVTILDVPRPNRDGTRLSCDAQGGPLPARAVVTNFAGEKTAILSYSVVCHDSRAKNILLSHAYDVRSSIDQNGYTTRVVRGEAHFRKDFLDGITIGGSTLQPDDFRQALALAVPSGMRRVGVEVDEPSAGDVLHYTIVDREVTFGIGLGDDVVDVDGSVTGGWDVPLKTPKDFLKLGFDLGAGVLKTDVVGNLGRIISAVVPSNRTYGSVRVTGRKGVPQRKLANVGVAFLIDRFSPLLATTSWIPHYFVTHGVTASKPPWCEIRMEITGTDPTNVISALDGSGMFNLSADYNSDGRLIAGPGVSAAALPGGGGTRGTWLKRMVLQALEPPTQDLPSVPPAQLQAIDFPAAV